MEGHPGGGPPGLNPSNNNDENMGECHSRSSSREAVVLQVQQEAAAATLVKEGNSKVGKKLISAKANLPQRQPRRSRTSMEPLSVESLLKIAQVLSGNNPQSSQCANAEAELNTSTKVGKVDSHEANDAFGVVDAMKRLIQVIGLFTKSRNNLQSSKVANAEAELNTSTKVGKVDSNEADDAFGVANAIKRLIQDIDLFYNEKKAQKCIVMH